MDPIGFNPTKTIYNTLPETNGKNPWKNGGLEGKFPFGKAYFQMQTVSFRRSVSLLETWRQSYWDVPYRREGIGSMVIRCLHLRLTWGIIPFRKGCKPFIRAGRSFSNTFRGSFSNTEQFRLHFYCQGHHFGPPEAEGHSKHTQGVIFKHTRETPGVIFKHKHHFCRQG